MKRLFSHIILALLFLSSGLQAEEESSERKAGKYWFIQPHRPNYILPLTYFNDPNTRPFSRRVNPNAQGDGSDAFEVKFQFSFKDTLVENTPLFGGDVVFAYTQVSYWQLYNVPASNPFRDTNYEPEGFMLFHPEVEIAGFKSDSIAAGFIHQSNGRGGEELSRDWNRVYVNARFTQDNLTVGLKPWLRVTSDEENPGIDDYYGHGELRLLYHLGESSFSGMFRNNFDFSGENKGAAELGWSRPLGERLRWYVQYFHGYGESLIDYDYLNQRIGFGIMLSDWY